MYMKQYHFIYLPYLLEDINSLVGNILENLKNIILHKYLLSKFSCVRLFCKVHNIDYLASVQPR